MMKVYIETYGCSANQSESEIMAGLVKKEGYTIINELDDSDFVIINTCFVKSPTEEKILRRITDIQKKYPKKELIIGGCMPEVINRKLLRLAPRSALISTHNITRIVEAIKKLGNNEKVNFVGKTQESKLCMPKIRKNRLVGITEISQGCNGKCSYCCVKLAKGNLYCYSPQKIIQDVTNALEEGCREIWITSQDNGAYSFKGMKLPGLIAGICKIPGDFKVRIGMINPDHVLTFTDGLIEAYRSEKVFKFVHLPIQSGSNTVLGKMNRFYGNADVLKIVKKLRKELPLITISTDVIVGFPTETESDFLKTKELLERMKPDIVNVSKFGAREGTDAKKMKPLDSKVVKKRSVEMSIFVKSKSEERNKIWSGWTGEIFISGKGRKKNQYKGRNISYKPVLVESQKNLLGKTVEVEITDYSVTHLVGRIKD